MVTISKWGVRVPYGSPRSEEERRARHKALYGSDVEPPASRGMLGPGEASVDDWAPENIAPFPLPPAIVPKWLARQVAGAGRKVKE